MPDARTPAPPRFLAEGELSGLVKNLRILGIDCAYSGEQSLPDAVNLAIRDSRMLLTLKPMPSTGSLMVYRLQTASTQIQLLQLVEAFSLTPHFHPFSRCLKCNQPLIPFDSTSGESLIPPSIRSRNLPIFTCPNCRKPFWNGSHVERMRARLRQWGLTLPKSDILQVGGNN